MMYFSCKEGKAVNVYDFDNTIYDGESGFDIFMFYLKKDPKEIAKLIPRFGEAFIRYKRGAIKTDEVIEQYGDMLTDYPIRNAAVTRTIRARPSGKYSSPWTNFSRPTRLSFRPA